MTAQSATGTAMQPVKAPVPVRQSPGELLDQFDSVYNSIARRAFELFEGDGQWFGRDLDYWLRAESELLHPVHMDVTESDGEFTVLAEVPGFTSKDLEIKVEPRTLRIAGKREIKQDKAGRKLRSECSCEQVLRAIELPVDVDPAKVNATLKDGILTIQLPKAANSKAIRVEAKSA